MKAELLKIYSASFLFCFLLWLSSSSAGAQETQSSYFSTPSKRVALDKYCHQVNAAIAKFGWKVNFCGGMGTHHLLGRSVQGNPLTYMDFGDVNANNRTLILAMVHGDEITPFYLAIRTALWLEENIHLFKGTRVVLVPLVNPDGFLADKRTRTNANGVDVNRNFETEIWKKEAISQWKSLYQADVRRNPGPFAGSEPETQFQQQLIDLVKPQKILSIHAPLGFMDYDGPSNISLDLFPGHYVKKCLELRERLKARSGGFFPGSLGNYAGQEKGIPTLTLELPTTNAASGRAYWDKFRQGIQTLVTFNVPDYEVTGAPLNPNQSN